MNSTEFIDIYVSELLQKTSKEDKSITLISDFDKDTNADSATNLDLIDTNFFSLTFQSQHM